ncbi:hypothetical protein K490DRAFT_59075 [Saccharata proteae CBS 121410]|uniref:Uncharacterized protein n=1 Tax=Saccharata proteae CBS 121410 TaxID=1314787 RepID=A0A9P4HS27_9PEZI|nr:hypothetical protein K490DRAFT_59075 [Saccharata proteae CBS 121410]
MDKKTTHARGGQPKEEMPGDPGSRSSPESSTEEASRDLQTIMRWLPRARMLARNDNIMAENPSPPSSRETTTTDGNCDLEVTICAISKAEMPFSTNGNVPAAVHHVLGLPELAGVILSQLPTVTDIRTARGISQYFKRIIDMDPSINPKLPIPDALLTFTIHMWKDQQHIVVFTYNSFLADVFTVPSWSGLVPADSRPYTAAETFLKADITAITPDAVAVLKSELQAISPYWRSRQLSNPPTTRMKLMISPYLEFEFGRIPRFKHKPDGITIGDVLDTVMEGLDRIRFSPFLLRWRGHRMPSWPPPTPKLQVLCMGPLFLVMMFHKWDHYAFWSRAMRHYVRWD